MILVFSWPWLWAGWAREFFETLHWLFWWTLGVNVGLK